MTDTPKSSDRVSRVSEMTQAMVDMVDRGIGKNLLVLADRLDEIADDTGNLTKADVIALLRREGERLKQTYNTDGPNPK